MKKSFWQIFNYRKLVFVLFTIMAFSLSWSTIKVIQKNYDLQQEVKQLEDEVALLELENENLKLNIAYFKSDTFLELAAREKFNKAEAGEKVLLLPKQTSVDDIELEEEIEEQDQSEKPQYRQNWDKWYEFIFGNDNT